MTPTKSARIEARVSPDERDRIERAASVAGMSASAFMVGAAVERAERMLLEEMTTVVPARYFDELVAALDAPDDAPGLARAARRARRRARISPG